jgi:Protein kinase domain
MLGQMRTKCTTLRYATCVMCCLYCDDRSACAHIMLSLRACATCDAAIYCSAVAYMHSKGFCHRDIKFENIMFDSCNTDSPVKVTAHM